MAAGERKLKVTVLGDAKDAKQALGSLDGKLGKVGKIGKAMGAAVVGASVAAGAGLVKLGSEFDSAYDAIAVGTGATGKQLEGLQKSFKNVVKDIPVDFGTAGAAISNLNTLTGATGPVLEDMTTAVAEASRLLGEDAVANSQAFGQTLKQWNVPAKDGADTMDMLFAATQKYGVGLGQIQGHLSTYGPVLANANFTMEEATTLFGQLEAGGISVSRVMPGLNKAFRDWAAEGKNSREELARVVTEIKSATTEQEALTIATGAFGAEGAQRMMTGIRSGIISLEDLGTALDGSKGSVEASAAATESFGEKWTKIKNRVFVALEPIAMRLFDLLGTGMDAVGKAADALMPHLTKIWDNISGGGDTVSGFVAGAKKAFDQFVGFITGTLVPTVVRMYQDNKKTFDQLQSTVQTVFEAIRSIIEAAVKVISWVWERFGDDILRYARQVFDSIMQVVRGALQIVQGIIKTVTAIIKGDWSAAWEGVKQILSGAFNFIVGAAKTYLLVGLGGLVKKALGGVLRLFTSILGRVVSAVGGALGRVVSAVAGALGRVVGRVTSGLGEVKGIFTSVWNGLVGIVKGVFRRIVGTVSGYISRIKRAIQGVFDDIGSLPGKMGSAVTRALGKIPGAGLVGSILGRWHGGSVRAGQPYIVGEKRPEVFVPHQSGRIEPRVNGAGGGVTIAQGAVQVTVHGSGNAMEIEAAVREALSDVVSEIRSGRR